MLAERRLHPRYQMTFPLQVEVEDGAGVEVFECEAVNLSKSTIEICGDGTVVAAFLAQQDYPHFGVLRLALPGTREELLIHCQLLTHRRLSQHRYHLVFSFADFLSGSHEALAHYLEGLQSQASPHARPL